MLASEWLGPKLRKSRTEVVHERRRGVKLQIKGDAVRREGCFLQAELMRDFLDDGRFDGPLPFNVAVNQAVFAQQVD